ncbi:MAG: hypothetical protein HY916_02995 [Desulfovibrio sp.]|jgi:hypothetical protein|nr:hypothetical protein [Desulfovibrio sp.]
MIRNSCAACGKAINRTDRFFEPSNGTLCQDCLARLVPGKTVRTGEVRMTPPPLFAMLPELLPCGQR